MRAPGWRSAKVGQVVRRRAGERVDRLVDVADDAQVRPVAEPQLEQSLLERARVLVLVDAEPALARADGLGGVDVVLEQADGLDEEVVEVDAALAGLGALVVLEDAHEQVDRDRRLASGIDARGLARVRARPDPARLRPLDLVGEVLRRREPEVAGELAREPAEDRDLGVEQLGQRLAVVARRPEVAQLAAARGRGTSAPSRPAARGRRSRSTISPAALSVNVTTSTWSGGTTSVADRVRRPAADHPRLAGARAREDRDRPARREHRLALLGIEVVEQAFGIESGHRPRLAGAAYPAASSRR